MKKIDLILSSITGIGVGFLFLWILSNSAFSSPLLWLLPIIFLVLAVFGIWIASLIGKKFLFIYQLAKFALIGACFAIFDLIIFNALVRWFGISQEDNYLVYSLLVGVSFVISTSAKFAADKYWAFEKSGSKGAGVEFGAFFAVTLVSGLIQIVIASLIFKAVPPVAGMNIVAWGNVGKIVGIVFASAWNFVGYKFFVFKK